MFTVTGLDDTGVPYRVAVYPEPVRAGADSHGCAVGSLNALTTLRAREGQQAAVTPTGPFLTVDRADPASTLAALRAFTTVTDVDGDAPDLLADDAPDGVVY